MFDGIVVKKDHDFGSLHGYRTKGVVSFYIETESNNDLQNIISTCKQKNLNFVPCGDGSNILIKDNFHGVFVNWLGSSIRLTPLEGDKVLLQVGAACKKSDLDEFCIKEGLSGLEFWAGIPGCVGGGVAMNAGAYGREAKDCISEISYTTGSGQYTVNAKDIKWSYRKVFLPQYAVITAATFELRKTSVAQVKQLSDSHVKDREDKHPLEFPSCGSVFKNPENLSKGAWWFIKEAGLSGFAIGGAKVSEKHSNFIINSGTATASDVINLIHEIKNKVREKFKLTLEEEIRIYS